MTIRPYIPLSIKLAVAYRQVWKSCSSVTFETMVDRWKKEEPTLAGQLKVALHYLEFKNPQLDHRPPLALRALNKRTCKYLPDANDPDYLEWIDKEPHLERTAGRGGTKSRVGGDIREIAKMRRIKKRNGLRDKRKPKGRPLRSANRWPPRKTRKITTWRGG